MNDHAFCHLAIALEEPVTVSRFARAFPERRASSFVLDGAGAPPTAPLDQFAFFGAEPSASFRATRLDVDAKTGRPRAGVVTTGSTFETDDPFGALQEFLTEHAAPPDVFDRAFPGPLRAGAVGYVGYECGQFLERLPCRPRPSIGMPDIALSIHRWIVATDRRTGRSWLSVLGVGDVAKTARADAEATQARILARLGTSRAPSNASSGASSGDPPRRDGAAEASAVHAILAREEYVDRVRAAKAHIEAGDAFEICLTNAHRLPFSQDRAWALFDELRRSSPAPFAALLDLPEGAIVSSSPERFVSLDARGRVESRPIKGTRPRGASPAEDRRLAEELLASPKDRAENAMIVDLVRNDLGRICRFGTVEVPELHAVESYATVHQLVSTVRGEIERGLGAVDVLRAAFPPGSMTGAPKIEAMTILERLEPVERGVYSGALGFIDAGGAMDLSVVIRTAVLRGETATFSVGGAVVADSDPHDEHDETEHKGRALVAALSKASRHEGASGTESAS